MEKEDLAEIEAELLSIDEERLRDIANVLYDIAKSLRVLAKRPSMDEEPLGEMSEELGDEGTSEEEETEDDDTSEEG